MKQSALLQHATCSNCGHKIGASGALTFWVVTVENYAVDIGAIQRQDGLANLLGSGRLASVMGPDEDMATALIEPTRLTLCFPCANAGICLPEIIERLSKQ